MVASSTWWWPATLPRLDKSVGMAVNYISAPLACQYIPRDCDGFLYTRLSARVCHQGSPSSLHPCFSFFLVSFAFSCVLLSLPPLFFPLGYTSGETASCCSRLGPPLRKYGPVITLAQGNYQLPGCRVEFYPIRGLLRPPSSSSSSSSAA